MDIVMAVAAWCSIIGFIFDSAENPKQEETRKENGA